MRALAGAALLIAVYVAPEHDTTGMRLLMGLMIGFAIPLLFGGMFDNGK